MKLPVIPTTIETHDNTMASAEEKCARWYKYRHVLGLAPPGHSPALEFGKLIHAGLDVWYATGDSDSALEAVFEYPYEEHPDDYRTKGRALTTMAAYMQYFSPETFDEILLTETAFDLVDDEGFRWGGRIDLIVVWQGKIYVVDHKTTSIGGPTWLDEFKISPQMAGYVWAGQLLHGQQVEGVIINRLKIQKTHKPPEEEFTRFPVLYGDHLIREWRETKIDQYHRLAERRERDHYPPNWTACVGRYGKCPAYDICRAKPESRERLLESRFVPDPWHWSKED